MSDQEHVLGRDVGSSQSLKDVEELQNAAGVQHGINAVPVRLQSNRSLHTMEAINKRAALKSHPLVLKYINKVWTVLQRNLHDRLEAREYANLYVRLCKILNPDFKLRDTLAAVREDFLRDAQGQSSLSYSQFVDSLFELVDVWCPEVSSLAYADFLERCFRAITVKVVRQKGGKTVQLKPVWHTNEALLEDKALEELKESKALSDSDSSSGSSQPPQTTDDETSTAGAPSQPEDPAQEPPAASEGGASAEQPETIVEGDGADDVDGTSGDGEGASQPETSDTVDGQQPNDQENAGDSTTSADPSDGVESKSSDGRSAGNVPAPTPTPAVVQQVPGLTVITPASPTGSTTSVESGEGSGEVGQDAGVYTSARDAVQDGDALQVYELAPLDEVVALSMSDPSGASGSGEGATEAVSPGSPGATTSTSSSSSSTTAGLHSAKQLGMARVLQQQQQQSAASHQPQDQTGPDTEHSTSGTAGDAEHKQEGGTTDSSDQTTTSAPNTSQESTSVSLDVSQLHLPMRQPAEWVAQLGQRMQESSFEVASFFDQSDAGHRGGASARLKAQSQVLSTEDIAVQSRLAGRPRLIDLLSPVSSTTSQGHEDRVYSGVGGAGDGSVPRVGGVAGSRNKNKNACAGSGPCGADGRWTGNISTCTRGLPLLIHDLYAAAEGFQSRADEQGDNHNQYYGSGETDGQDWEGGQEQREQAAEQARLLAQQALLATEHPPGMAHLLYTDARVGRAVQPSRLLTAPSAAGRAAPVVSPERVNAGAVAAPSVVILGKPMAGGGHLARLLSHRLGLINVTLDLAVRVALQASALKELDTQVSRLRGERILAAQEARLARLARDKERVSAGEDGGEGKDREASLEEEDQSDPTDVMPAPIDVLAGEAEVYAALFQMSAEEARDLVGRVDALRRTAAAAMGSESQKLARKVVAGGTLSSLETARLLADLIVSPQACTRGYVCAELSCSLTDLEAALEDVGGRAKGLWPPRTFVRLQLSDRDATWRAERLRAMVAYAQTCGAGGKGPRAYPASQQELKESEMRVRALQAARVPPPAQPAEEGSVEPSAEGSGEGDEGGSGSTYDDQSGAYGDETGYSDGGGGGSSGFGEPDSALEDDEEFDDPGAANSDEEQEEGAGRQRTLLHCQTLMDGTTVETVPGQDEHKIGGGEGVAASDDATFIAAAANSAAPSWLSTSDTLTGPQDSVGSAKLWDGSPEQARRLLECFSPLGLEPDLLAKRLRQWSRDVVSFSRIVRASDFDMGQRQVVTVSALQSPTAMMSLVLRGMSNSLCFGAAGGFVPVARPALSEQQVTDGLESGFARLDRMGGRDNTLYESGAGDLAVPACGVSSEPLRERVFERTGVFQRFCPVALQRNGQLIPGNPQLPVVYQGTLYLCSTAEARAQLLDAPYRYVGAETAELPGCYRVLVVGPVEAGSRELCANLRDNFGFSYLSISDLPQDPSTARERYPGRLVVDASTLEAVSDLNLLREVLAVRGYRFNQILSLDPVSVGPGRGLGAALLAHQRKHDVLKRASAGVLAFVNQAQAEYEAKEAESASNTRRGARRPRGRRNRTQTDLRALLRAQFLDNQGNVVPRPGVQQALDCDALTEEQSQRAEALHDYVVECRTILREAASLDRDQLYGESKSGVDGPSGDQSDSAGASGLINQPFSAAVCDVLSQDADLDDALMLFRNETDTYCQWLYDFQLREVERREAEAAAESKAGNGGGGGGGGGKPSEPTGLVPPPDDAVPTRFTRRQIHYTQTSRHAIARTKSTQRALVDPFFAYRWAHRARVLPAAELRAVVESEQQETSRSGAAGQIGSNALGLTRRLRYGATVFCPVCFLEDRRCVPGRPVRNFAVLDAVYACCGDQHALRFAGDPMRFHTRLTRMQDRFQTLASNGPQSTAGAAQLSFVPVPAPRVLLVGGRGSGKTSAARFLHTHLSRMFPQLLTSVGGGDAGGAWPVSHVSQRFIPSLRAVVTPLYRQAAMLLGAFQQEWQAYLDEVAAAREARRKIAVEGGAELNADGTFGQDSEFTGTGYSSGYSDGAGDEYMDEEPEGLDGEPLRRREDEKVQGMLVTDLEAAVGVLRDFLVCQADWEMEKCAVAVLKSHWFQGSGPEAADLWGSLFHKLFLSAPPTTTSTPTSKPATDPSDVSRGAGYLVEMDVYLPELVDGLIRLSSSSTHRYLLPQTVLQFSASESDCAQRLLAGFSDYRPSPLLCQKLRAEAEKRAAQRLRDWEVSQMEVPPEDADLDQEIGSEHKEDTARRLAQLTDVAGVLTARGSHPCLSLHDYQYAAVYRTLYAEFVAEWEAQTEEQVAQMAAQALEAVASAAETGYTDGSESSADVTAPTSDTGRAGDSDDLPARVAAVYAARLHQPRFEAGAALGFMPEVMRDSDRLAASLASALEGCDVVVFGASRDGVHSEGAPVLLDGTAGEAGLVVPEVSVERDDQTTVIETEASGAADAGSLLTMKRRALQQAAYFFTHWARAMSPAQAVSKSDAHYLLASGLASLSFLGMACPVCEAARAQQEQSGAHVSYSTHAGVPCDGWAPGVEGGSGDALGLSGVLAGGSSADLSTVLRDAMLPARFQDQGEYERVLEAGLPSTGVRIPLLAAIPAFSAAFDPTACSSAAWSQASALRMFDTSVHPLAGVVSSHVIPGLQQPAGDSYPLLWGSGVGGVTAFYCCSRQHRSSLQNNTLSALRACAGRPVSLSLPPRVAVMGPPLSGKTTQSLQLAGRTGSVYLSPLQAVRAVCEQTLPCALGLHLTELLRKGETIPPALVAAALRVVAGWAQVRLRGWILDGFPFDLDSAVALKTVGMAPSMVLRLRYCQPPRLLGDGNGDGSQDHAGSRELEELVRRREAQEQAHRVFRAFAGLRRQLPSGKQLEARDAQSEAVTAALEMAMERSMGDDVGYSDETYSDQTFTDTGTDQTAGSSAGERSETAPGQDVDSLTTRLAHLQLDDCERALVDFLEQGRLQQRESRAVLYPQAAGAPYTAGSMQDDEGEDQDGTAVRAGPGTHMSRALSIYPPLLTAPVSESVGSLFGLRDYQSDANGLLAEDLDGELNPAERPAAADDEGQDMSAWDALQDRVAQGGQVGDADDVERRGWLSLLADPSQTADFVETVLGSLNSRFLEARLRASWSERRYVQRAVRTRRPLDTEGGSRGNSARRDRSLSRSDSFSGTGAGAGGTLVSSAAARSSVADQLEQLSAAVQGWSGAWLSGEALDADMAAVFRAHMLWSSDSQTESVDLLGGKPDPREAIPGSIGQAVAAMAAGAVGLPAASASLLALVSWVRRHMVQRCVALAARFEVPGFDHDDHLRWDTARRLQALSNHLPLTQLVEGVLGVAVQCPDDRRFARCIPGVAQRVVSAFWVGVQGTAPSVGAAKAAQVTALSCWQARYRSMVGARTQTLPLGLLPPTPHPALLRAWTQFQERAVSLCDFYSRGGLALRLVPTARSSRKPQAAHSPSVWAIFEQMWALVRRASEQRARSCSDMLAQRPIRLSAESGLSWLETANNMTGMGSYCPVCWVDKGELQVSSDLAHAVECRGGQILLACSEWHAQRLAHEPFRYDGRAEDQRLAAMRLGVPMLSPLWSTPTLSDAKAESGSASFSGWSVEMPVGKQGWEVLAPLDQRPERGQYDWTGLAGLRAQRATHALPATLPVLVKPAHARTFADEQCRLGGYCPVRYVRALRRDSQSRRLDPGMVGCTVWFQGALYRMAGAEELTEFMSRPFLYAGVAEPARLMPREPHVPDMLGTGRVFAYLSVEVGQLIQQALCIFQQQRPLLPGLGPRASALLFLALYLRAVNPHADPDLRARYSKVFVQYAAHCRLPGRVARLLRETTRRLREAAAVNDGQESSSASVAEPPQSHGEQTSAAAQGSSADAASEQPPSEGTEQPEPVPGPAPESDLSVDTALEEDGDDDRVLSEFYDEFPPAPLKLGFPTGFRGLGANLDGVAVVSAEARRSSGQQDESKTTATTTSKTTATTTTTTTATTSASSSGSDPIQCRPLTPPAVSYRALMARDQFSTRVHNALATGQRTSRCDAAQLAVLSVGAAEVLTRVEERAEGRMALAIEEGLVEPGVPRVGSNAGPLVLPGDEQAESEDQSVTSAPVSLGLSLRFPKSAPASERDTQLGTDEEAKCEDNGGRVSTCKSASCAVVPGGGDLPAYRHDPIACYDALLAACSRPIPGDAQVSSRAAGAMPVLRTARGVAELDAFLSRVYFTRAPGDLDAEQ